MPDCKILLVEATSATTANLGTAVNTAVAHGRGRGLEQLRRLGELERPDATSTTYYKHAGVAITASCGDERLRREYPGRVAVRHGRRRHVALAGERTRAAGRETVVDDGAGSGCSAYEAKPSLQNDTGCARRTIADVSAVADPNTGVAVYDSYGSGGWTVFGGTSAPSPIIAAVYALATPPTAGIYPTRTRTRNPGALFDVTSGSNGSCSPAVPVHGAAPATTGRPASARRTASPPSGPAGADQRLLDRGQPDGGDGRGGVGTTATVSTATTSAARAALLTASGCRVGAVRRR